MRYRAYLIFPTVSIVFLSALFFIARTAHAESVLWSTAQDDLLLCSSAGVSSAPNYACWLNLQNPSVQIEYHAQVVNASTGAIIQCGSSVPARTPLEFKFVPHIHSDVSWFGTGNTFDSPFGEWRDDAAPEAIECVDKDYVNDYVADSKVYIPLVVAPPAESLSGLDALGCANDTAATCTPTAAGTLNASFNFGSTYAKFYGRAKVHSGENLLNIDAGYSQTPMQCVGSNDPMQKSVGFIDNVGFTLSPYTLPVPAQQISCPITVTGPIGNPPATPTLTSGGQCTIGTAQTISMTSTDPDNDQLRYGVDWNADGSIDQWVPATGYVPSGTTQTAYRTYALAGSKSVKALAQDKNGNSSGWATLSFNCAGSTTVGINENDNAANDDIGGGSNASLLPDLDLRVIPSLVRSGDTTKVNWSSANVKSCTVSGQNGDAWSALQSPLGGNISKPITGETTYTLSCLTPDGTSLSKQATVRIIPTFQEL